MGFLSTRNQLEDGVTLHSEDDRRPLVFLDLDDVVALNKTVGGYDVALALNNPDTKGSLEASAELWGELMDQQAVAYLAQVHEEFGPLYVLSTSWAWVMHDGTLREALRRSGLKFVADNLHPDMTTPKGRKPIVRWHEIAAWLSLHPEFEDRWVVLDDDLSGTGLGEGLPAEVRNFIVLCEKDVGLTSTEYQLLRTALQVRTSAN